MGSISLPVVALIATGASVAFSAYESHAAGVAASNTAKQKARVEADAATQKQIEIRQNMLRALATQNAMAGVGGIGTGGSFGANVKRQLTQEQNDLMVVGANSSAQVSLLDQQAANARSAGDIGAAGDLIGGAGSVLTGVSKLPKGQ